MLVAPLWMFGARGVGRPSLASGWEMGLYVLLYYPPAVAMLFIVGWLHRWTSRKAARPRVDLWYLAAAHACLAVAVIVMAAALIRILR
jgi:hypothetical protein